MTRARMSIDWFLSPWRSRITIAIVTVAAFLPVLRAEVLGLDDTRFIVANESIHELSVSRVISFFTDPSTVSAGGEQWAGIYRPLRTLDFAVDWAIAGKTAWFYHLRNLLYHVLASLLALAVFRKLTTNRAAAFFGALLFALHPVQVEAVAWITSRGDVLLLVLFLLALLLHLRGRYILACLALLAALFSKETAVVFPGIVLIVDLLHRPGAWKSAFGALLGRGPPAEPKGTAAPTGLRGVPVHLRWYAAYGTIVIGYYLLWLSIQPYAGHLAHWWGGSWPANLQMVIRSVVWYAKALLIPVNFVYDDHVPAVTTLDPGTVLGVGLIVAAGVGLWKGSPRLRMAIAWSLVAIFPVSNILFTVAIPTAERFLYLPSVGLAFAAGHLLARVPRRAISFAVLACLGALTFFRCLDWKNDETLFAASFKVDVTPRGYLWQASEALKRAWKAHEKLAGGRDDPEAAARLRREAETTVAAADGLVRYYGERLNVPPLGVGGVILWKKANALLALGRDEEAYLAGKLAASEVGAESFAHFNAGIAAERLGERREGGAEAAQTHRDATSVITGALSGSAAPGLAAGLARAVALGAGRRSRLRAAEYFEEAGNYLSTAHHVGYTVDDLRERIAALYWRAGTIRDEAAGLEIDEERKGELREAAARTFFYAGNALSALYGESRSKDHLENSIKLQAVAGKAWLGAVESLDEYRTPGHLADLIRSAANCYKLVAHGQEVWGDPVEALRTFVRATSIYENALRLATLAEGGSGKEEARQGAAYCLFHAGRIAEGLNDIDAAVKLYTNSLGFVPTPEADAALRRLGR